MTLALVHDYLTQRGGAERVVLAMTRAFPTAPVHTSLYDPAGTFPEFASVAVRPSGLDRVRPLRRHHRLALPALASTFGRMTVEADVAVCSSTGWAHGVTATGRKIVYCHNVARWLYQPGDYLQGRQRMARPALALLAPRLRRWDVAAAATAARYLVNSRVVRDRVRSAYGIEAEVLPPPPALVPQGPVAPVPGLAPGFVLCVSRLLPYKHVDRVVAAFRELPDERLVVVGSGPEAAALRRSAGPNVTLLGRQDDRALRGLYDGCQLLVAASHEDYGLTPLEAAGFGKPTVALRYGGYLDTVQEGVTGLFFDAPTPGDIARGLREALAARWSAASLRAHAETFSERRFAQRLHAVVAEVAGA